MTKKYHITYITILAFIVGFILLGYYYTPLQPLDTNIQTIQATSITQTADFEREFLFNVAEIDSDKNDLAFFTKHQFIQIYSDDTLIYDYTKDGGIWGHTTGAFWVCTDIPHDTEALRIIFTSAYDDVKDDIPNFYLGDKLAIYQEVLRHSLPSLLVSVLIMIFGIVLILYWIFMFRRFDIGKSLLYLGIFSTMVGMYFLNETDASIAVIRHRTASLLVTYLLLICLCPTSIYFFKEFLGTVEDVIWKILCSLSLTELILGVALQFLNIMDLRETLFVTHGIIGMTAIYLLVTLCIKLRRHEYTPMLRASIVSVAVLAVCVFFNLASYYSNTAVSDTSVISRLGFLIFIFVLSLESAKNTFALMEKGRHAKIFEELAITDVLTGLNNRNAYIRDIDALTNIHDIMILTCDLNNLKKCNDTLGHAEGDAYILGAANIIKDVFSPYGSCYRIGGDEFCVLIKNALLCPIAALTSSLEEKEMEYNSGNPAFPMHISYGYATFDSRIDLNLEQTRDRADALMYEHKRKSKER